MNVYRDDMDHLDRAQAPAGRPAGASQPVVPNTLSEGVRVSAPPREGFLTASFAWMFVGVLLSAASAAFLMNDAGLQAAVMDVWIFLLFGQLGLVLAISFLITRIPPLVALGLFFAYALAMGLVIGVVVLAYSQAIGLSGVVSAFVGAAAVFGGAAFYGAVTGRDLTRLGGILFMGLIGLVVVLIAQLFLFPGSGPLSLGIGIVGVLIFTGLTAWDVQRIRNGAVPGVGPESASVMGALALYLDFVNLFLFMLRIFSSSR